MPIVHFDEAKRAAIDAIEHWTAPTSDDVRVLLIADLFGKLRLVVWCDNKPNLVTLNQQLTASCTVWWTGEVLYFSELDDMSKVLYERLWQQARQELESSKLRVTDRHRSRTAWFAGVVNQPWTAPEDGPPIVVFYSFKGGLGRSTTLASFAIQRAKLGDRVCVLDFDLDSPGIGRLLSADDEGLTARWGVVDFLLERAAIDAPLSDYYHRCDRVSDTGQIFVFPAGNLDEEYADKLARIDLEETPNASDSGIWTLLNRIRSELKPQWILMDARTGISEPAGQLLSGIAHLHVLLGTTNPQSWLGLNQIIDRLGKDRVLADRAQEQILLVQAMVPIGEAGKAAKSEFSGMAENEFDTRYYAADEAGNDEQFWVLADKGTEDAPHVPMAIEYEAKLGSFSDITEISDTLCQGQYQLIAAHLAARFSNESDI